MTTEERIKSIIAEFDERVEQVGLATARLELARALERAESAMDDDEPHHKIYITPRRKRPAGIVR